MTRRDLGGEVALDFSLGKGVGVGDTVDGWRERFAEHAVVVLGPASFDGKPTDSHGRFPLTGVTSRSVKRVELRYESGPPTVATGVQGGFVLLADARRPSREVVAYDGSGRELDRVAWSFSGNPLAG